jgi:hypothetical protein
VAPLPPQLPLSNDPPVLAQARIICIKTLDDQGSAPTSYIVAALDMVRAAKAANPSVGA